MADGTAAERDSGSKGRKTRERLLDAASDAILSKGFAGTSIDELVEACGITKSGFFYHFRDKGDLARQLLSRFLVEDDAVMDALTERAEASGGSVLNRFVAFLNLYAEMMDELEEVHPGCLVAAILYQEQAFDREVRQTLLETALRWRSRFRSWFEEIELETGGPGPVDLDTIADSFSAVVEGSIILTRALDDRKLLGRQLRLFGDMVRATYGETALHRQANA